MDLIDSIQEYLLNCPQHISLWKGKTGAAMKTVDEIFAELEGMLWWGSNEDISYNCAEVTAFPDDPFREWQLTDMMTVDLERKSSIVTFIDLTNCEEDDFATEYSPDY